MRIKNTGLTINSNQMVVGVCYILVVLSLWMVNYGFTFSRVAGLVLFVLISVFMPIESIMFMIVLLEPFNYVFKFQGSLSVMPFLIAICIIKMLFRKKEQIERTKLVLYSLLVLLCVTASFLELGSMLSCIPFLMYLLFIVLCARDFKNSMYVLFDSLAKVYIASTLLACFSALLFSRTALSVSPMAENIYLHRFYGLSTVWEIGRSLVVSIVFLFVLLLKNKKHYLISFAIIGVLLYFLVLTQTYSVILGIVAVVLVMPLMGGKKINTKTIVLFIMSVVIFIIGYFVIFKQMLSIRGDFGDNGRFAIWELYGKSFVLSGRRMLIGIGGGCISQFAARHQILTAHNIIVEKVFELGIIGTVLLFSFLIMSYKGLNMNLRKNLHLLPLIAFLGTSLTQGTTGSELLVIVLVVCIVPQGKEMTIGYNLAKN